MGGVHAWVAHEICNTPTFTHTQGSNTRRTQRRPHTAQNHIAADHRPDQSTGSRRTTPHAEQQARRGSIQAHPRHLSSHDGEVGGRVHTVAARRPCQAFEKV